MKRFFMVIVAISVMGYAASSEKCNPGTSPANTDANLHQGWCYNEGYVFNVTTEATGGVRFSLGKNDRCNASEMEVTRFITHPLNSDGSLNTNVSVNVLRRYLEEGLVDNVSALAVAINTAFIINAFNEKIKVRVTYHQYGDVHDENSVRLLAIGKIP
jgi:hypothetical protein